MFETLDELKIKEKELDRYKKYILRQKGFMIKDKEPSAT